jgi:hypothetical protein
LPIFIPRCSQEREKQMKEFEDRKKKIRDEQRMGVII